MFELIWRQNVKIMQTTGPVYINFLVISGGDTENKNGVSINSSVLSKPVCLQTQILVTKNLRYASIRNVQNTCFKPFTFER